MVRGLPSLKFVLIATVLLGAARVAVAHPAPFSFLDLVIGETSTEGVLVLHVVDVAHELGIDPADRLLDPVELARVRDRVVALIAPRLTISTATARLTTANGWKKARRCGIPRLS